MVECFALIAVRVAAVIASTVERRQSNTERAGLSYLNMIDKNSYRKFLYRSHRQNETIALGDSASVSFSLFHLL